MATKADHPVLSFEDWKYFVREAFKAFPMVWWRIGTITLLVFIGAGSGAFLFGVLEYFLLGGLENVQNVMANVKMGGYLTFYEASVVWGAFVLGAVWMIVAIVLGKIGNLLIMKAYFDKKERKASPFSIYGLKGWPFVYRYIMLFLRMIWYAGWVALFTGMVYAGVISHFAEAFFFDVLGLLSLSVLLVFFTEAEEGALEITTEFHRLIALVPDQLNVAFVVLGFFAFGFVVYRGFRTAFVQQVLIHFENKSVTKTFQAALKMVEKVWWQVFLSIFAYFVFINVVRVLFLLPELLMSYEMIAVSETLLALAQGVDLFFCLFILMPLMISFMYVLMLHFSKIKNIKP